MLANKQTVKDFVYSVADMRASSWERRYWADKAKDTTKRNLAFKFADAAEADTVAAQLQAMLTQKGYANKVKRTSTGADIYYRTGGEYVRVQVLQ